MLQGIVLSCRFSQLDYEGISSPHPRSADAFSPTSPLYELPGFLSFPEILVSQVFISKVIHPTTPPSGAKTALLCLKLFVFVFVVHLPGRLHEYTRVRIQMSAEPKSY